MPSFSPAVPLHQSLPLSQPRPQARHRASHRRLARLARLSRLPRLILCLAALCASALAAAAPQPVQDFFDNPSFGGARLSPSGKYVVAKVSLATGRDALGVVELATGKITPVAGFSDGDIGHFRWISDERLLYDSTDKERGAGQVMFAPGLFAVDRDGKNFRQLAQRDDPFITSGPTKMLPWHTYMLQQDGAQDSDTVYVQSATFEAGGSVASLDLLRLDTRTGRSMPVRTPGHVQHWVLDAKGEPRMAISLEKGKRTIWLLENEQWRELTSFDAWVAAAGSFSPLGFGANGTLYVAARYKSDKTAIHTFDLAAGKVNPQPMFSIKDYDFTGHLLKINGKLAGIRYEGEIEDTEWFDADAKAVQAAVDAKLKGMINLVDLPARPASPFALVTTYSDMQPPVYFTYNRDTGKLTPLGQAHEKIDALKSGRQDLVRYAARDGMQIPALLTLPHGATRKDKLPMVVLVHGGPWVRGANWGWSPDSQFLASRGYAVLEPDFRGSTGYGAKHWKAGLKQWGLAMQDDIADGTRWAIDQGIADPRRICIAGASYGGYATLMGLIKDAELYRCGIDWAGVTDIKLMYGGGWFNWSDMPEQYVQYGMPKLIGDLEQDAAQLKATSPVEQAGRLKQPLLMAYGGADKRVPLAHGKRFRDAVKETNKDVEWVEYTEEGHGWRLVKNRVDFWTRVEKFLDRHIGAGSGMAGGNKAE